MEFLAHVIFKKRRKPSSTIDQGDVYSNVNFFQDISMKNGKAEVKSQTFSYAIVLTQTCDLARIADTERGFSSILSVLVAPLFPASVFKEGRHLAQFGVENNGFGGKKNYEYCKKGEKPRFFVLELEGGTNEGILNGLPDSMVVDFKYYFTVDPSQLSPKHYCTTLKPFHREDLSRCFANYLSRIGIPE